MQKKKLPDHKAGFGELRTSNHDAGIRHNKATIQFSSKLASAQDIVRRRRRTEVWLKKLTKTLLQSPTESKIRCSSEETAN
jgi:hypothetical protein